MKYIKFTENNEFHSRFDSDFQTIPEGAIQITEDEFRKSINEQDGIWCYDPTEKRIYKKPFPKRSLAEVQAEVWDKIQSVRDSLKSGGVKVKDKWFQTDTDSRIQYLGLKDIARDLPTREEPVKILNTPVAWKTCDGTFEVITVDTIYEIVKKITELDALIFSIAVQHRERMMKEEDPSGYVYQIGWPETYK